METNKLMGLLEESIAGIYKNRALADCAIKDICEISNNIVWKKYKNVKIFRDGMTFELFKVESRMYPDFLHEIKIDLDLIYFCTSKLPKIKMDKIEEAKKNVNNRHFLQHCNFKHPLWFENTYEILASEILSENINLETL